MERFVSFEEWAILLRGHQTKRFHRLGPVRVRGFTALDIGCNAQRVERTYRDVRLDGADHYFAVFPIDGQLAMTHNDQAVRLAPGDVALVDAALPVTYSADGQGAPWNTVSLNLPRQTLISHLGFEPEGGLYKRRGTPAGRLLFDLFRDRGSDKDSESSLADSYMQLAVYDLIGALFAPSDAWPVSRHTDKLFARIRDVIKNGFADPDFGPYEVAAKTGISLRYLQKLFTQRGMTCSEFIYFPPCAHASARAREKSLKNFRLVPLRRRYVHGVARSPLSCRSCRHRSWSGWGGMEQRKGIVDLGAETAAYTGNNRGWRRVTS